MKKCKREQKLCIKANKWFFLEDNPKKAQKCIEEFDSDGDKKWTMMEWLAFDKLMGVRIRGESIPVNFKKIYLSRGDARTCIPDPVLPGTPTQPEVQPPIPEPIQPEIQPPIPEPIKKVVVVSQGQSKVKIDVKIELSVEPAKLEVQPNQEPIDKVFFDW